HRDAPGPVRFPRYRRDAVHLGSAPSGLRARKSRTAPGRTTSGGGGGCFNSEDPRAVRRSISASRQRGTVVGKEPVGRCRSGAVLLHGDRNSSSTKCEITGVARDDEPRAIARQAG